jgi:hypothetical protein
LAADPRGKLAVSGPEIRVLRAAGRKRGQAEGSGEPPAARTGPARACLASRLIVPGGSLPPRRPADPESGTAPLPRWFPQ